MNDFSPQTPQQPQRLHRRLTPAGTTATTEGATQPVGAGPEADPPHDAHELHADHDDGIYAALAEAADRGRVVVVALVDGTRLNGVPLGFIPPSSTYTTADPARRRWDCTERGHRTSRAGQRTGWAGDRTAVLIREEFAQPPFVVRLEHVVYVRALTAGRD